MSDLCTHLDQVGLRELPASVDGCEECLRDGGKWLHLRICLTCGHVGCCDDSPNRHAPLTTTQHRIRSSARLTLLYRLSPALPRFFTESAPMRRPSGPTIALVDGSSRWRFRVNCP